MYLFSVGVYQQNKISSIKLRERACWSESVLFADCTNIRLWHDPTTSAFGEQRRPRSNCANAPADLRLCCSQIIYIVTWPHNVSFRRTAQTLIKLRMLIRVYPARRLYKHRLWLDPTTSAFGEQRRPWSNCGKRACWSESTLFADCTNTILWLDPVRRLYKH